MIDANGNLHDGDISAKIVGSVRARTVHWFSSLLEEHQEDDVLPDTLVLT
jgi:hypothetical protein